jgi:hypothetical protein
MIRMPRVASATLVGALVLGLAVGTATTASAAPDDRAGRWLEGQLSGGLIHNDDPAYGGFDDYGLTADTGLALVAVGGHGQAVKRIRGALARHVDSWTTGVDFDSADVYAGGVAKAVVLAQTTGADPRHFGGVNLVNRLTGLVSGDRGIVGRIQDKSEYGDYANTLGQAFAAAGLTRARSSEAPAAVRFLLEQQCAAGYFRLSFADATAADQTCDGAARGDRAPDTDATAIALVNLQSIKHPTAKVKRAIADGAGWLVRRQKENGSFGGGPTTEAANANSSGLAAWALGQAGRCTSAAQAARWISRLQLKNGAIAYDRAALRSARQHGITATTADQWRRASAQAAPGLVVLTGCRA